MKCKLLVSAMLIIALALGFVLLGCPDETGGGEDDGAIAGEAKPNPPTEEIADLFDPDITFPRQLSDSRKIWGMYNPIITYAYLADPVPMVYCPTIENSGQTEQHGEGCDECILYMYGSNDTLAFNSSGAPITSDFGIVIQGLRVVSTKDLVNWTDHGPLNFVQKTSTHPLFPTPTSKVAPYANDTWAPSAEWKMVGGKPEVYLYWCNAGNNTSVVVGEGPLGPWKNPGLTQSMINRSMPNGDSSWLFDPGTMMEPDGTTYMVLGGDGGGYNPGNARRVKLDESNVAIDGSLEKYIAPYMFEASDLWKWNDIYYLNYTVNWSVSGNPYGFGNIAVSCMMNRDGPLYSFPVGTSTNPPDQTKQWGAPKNILPNGPYGDSTNHASLFDYKGQPYLVYHASSACQAYGATRLRVAHLEKVELENDGTVKSMTMGIKGVPSIEGFNPFNRVEAETMAIGGGIYTKHDESASNGIVVASIDTGDWLGLYDVDFGEGATKFNAKVRVPKSPSNYVGAIEIRINPEQQGIANPLNSTTLGTGKDRQSRITGGEVIGRMQIEVAKKEDAGKFILAKANLDTEVTGKQNLVFVFYSSTGEYLEQHTAVPTPATDGRARNVGFEFDQWWFE